jgi:hypothetical protein
MGSHEAQVKIDRRMLVYKGHPVDRAVLFYVSAEGARKCRNCDSPLYRGSEGPYVCRTIDASGKASTPFSRCEVSLWDLREVEADVLQQMNAIHGAEPADEDWQCCGHQEQCSEESERGSAP